RRRRRVHDFAFGGDFDLRRRPDEHVLVAVVAEDAFLTLNLLGRVIERNHRRITGGGLDLRRRRRHHDLVARWTLHLLTEKFRTDGHQVLAMRAIEIDGLHDDDGLECGRGFVRAVYHG